LSSLAYPANAKLISEALADVPQAYDLPISFSYWQSTVRLHECSMPYPVMAIEYSYNKASQYTPHSFEEMGRINRNGLLEFNQFLRPSNIM
jgi:hypothetical protein